MSHNNTKNNFENLESKCPKSNKELLIAGLELALEAVKNADENAEMDSAVECAVEFAKVLVKGAAIEAVREAVKNADENADENAEMDSAVEFAKVIVKGATIEAVREAVKKVNSSSMRKSKKTGGSLVRMERSSVLANPHERKSIESGILYNGVGKMLLGR